ncbi:hypothetical protein [Mucilaginibacter sp. OK283]|jgi:hypothetical protein|uniref:hypothetical protein n=1 Tax=Mucilaginibacter sp. OK283 TaxID=1881049 RepID=UPI000B8980B8|nr:hypothetical protein [Mucilaginibacter sp. OK283]
MDDKNICNIKAETKLRNGYPNWWCFTHFASARGEGGAKMDRCIKANMPKIIESEKIYIDIDEYRGGVGVWGSLEAVYDSKRVIPEKGVHVHLRKTPDAEKEVDKTFKEVYIKVPGTLFEDEQWIMIDEYTACAYTASVLFDRKIKVITCKHCKKPHIDADWFAVHYHKKHFCTYCGRDFIDTEPGISNPIVYLQGIFQERLANRKLINVDRVLRIKQEDYPGGIQIWASNPAIIWTAERAEEAGIHVHLFKEKSGMPFSDDTYGTVEIDGILLDAEMVRFFMVQKSFGFLGKFVVSLACPKCSKEHFDKGENAFKPHKTHDCEHCGNVFDDGTRYKGVVSNPIVAKLQALDKIHQNLNYD